MNCKRCGARLPRGMAICPDCGARQRQETGRVRCAHCGKSALAELTVCPHCGRTLRPAGPRWGVWLTGVAAVVLAVLMALNRLPVRAAWQQAVRLQERLTGLVQIPALPAAPSPGATVRAGADTLSRTATAPTGRTPVLATPRAALVLSVTLTVMPPTATSTAMLAIGGAISTTTPAATATATPAPPSPTPAPPSPTPAPPTATPTGDTARYYTVRPGDTFIDIGNATGFDWQDIAAANGLTANSLLLPGMKLRLPGSGTDQAATPTAASAPRKYRVQAGDSLMVIGDKFGVPWQSIAQANKLTANSVLQVGQELIIPAN